MNFMFKQYGDLQVIDVKITKHLMGDSPGPQQRKYKLLDESSRT